MQRHRLSLHERDGRNESTGSREVRREEWGESDQSNSLMKKKNVFEGEKVLVFGVPRPLPVYKWARASSGLHYVETGLVLSAGSFLLLSSKHEDVVIFG